MLERYCELENGSLRKDDEERDNIRRYILQKYPTVVEKYKSHHNLPSFFPISLGKISVATYVLLKYATASLCLLKSTSSKAKTAFTA